jgi:hypothetical protein
MPNAAELVQRYKLTGAALAVSAALHAAVFVGMPPRLASIDEPAGIAYSASLDPAAVAEASAAPPAPKAAPKPAAKPRAKRIAVPIPVPPAPEDVAPAPAEPVSVANAAPEPVEPEKVETPKPEMLAMAQPAVPIPALEPPKFPVAALPEKLSITYRLTSPIADGRAVYEWTREGDRYEITSEAEAVGFVTLFFLEGRIRQKSVGVVTPEGLRPDRFTEFRTGADDEGVAFDWTGKQVTFERYGKEPRSQPLTDNSIDWLSMIFQMAHVPPAGERFDLHVFTQRRFYAFKLRVLGVEEIEVPIGKVRATHLRHEDGNEVVDVWLGLDQHNLPVKLRYPVAKNRITVEQVATSISQR